MDLPITIKALILGIVEGLTEFLPISSTGHLIVVGQLLRFNDEKGKLFEIVIQTGAMLAVVWEYRTRFRRVIVGLGHDPASRRFVVNLFVAFLPAAVVGLAFNKWIHAHLFEALPVALAFIVGALVILWVERRPRVPSITNVDQMTWRDALKVGCAQMLALIPGTSRSGATIIGGMLFGLSRPAATEFSFFLAVPTLVAAGAYDLYKHRSELAASDIGLFSVGLGAAFVSAFLCVRWLLHYVARNTFKPFAWYRIAFGGLIILTWYLQLVDWTRS